MSRLFLRNFLKLSLIGAAVAASSCVERGEPIEETARLRVSVVLEDGSPLPAADQPLPIDLLSARKFKLVVEALLADGTIDTRFNGFVRVSVEPGGIDAIVGPGVVGRSIMLVAGASQEHMIEVSGAYGDTRVWAEDLGYLPADPLKPPRCSNLLDDNGNGLADYPADPGCAFANDDTEEGGTYAAGVSPPVHYSLPTIAELQGLGSLTPSMTPFANEQVQVKTSAPANLIVTRISSDGFYVTDINAQVAPENVGKYTSLFAFNFNQPWGMRVCDRVTSLSGTMSEFFGYTEMGFPSFSVHQWRLPTQTDPGDGPCQVPEPNEITDAILPSSSGAAVALEPWESSLVRVRDVRIASHFGPDKVPADTLKPGPNASNCDLNDDGEVDYATPGSVEMACSNNCFSDPECSEWSSYASRGNFRLVVGNSSVGIMANLGGVPEMDAYGLKGEPIAILTGTIRHFSGGDLNWTIEARCSDDVVYCPPGDQYQACAANPPLKPITEACVLPRTEYDPDEGTN